MTAKNANIFGMTGAVLLFAGLVVQFMKLDFAPYIYLVGSILFAYAQFVTSPETTNFAIRRLRRQQLLGAMLLIMTGVMMLLWRHNEWIICLTIAALLELYTAFRIPHEEAKEKGGK